MAINKFILINETTEEEAFSNTFRKSCPKQLLQEFIENPENANIRIKIDDFTMDCHLVVLQCYSELFHEFRGGMVVELPPEKVSSHTFVSIYKWMLEDTPIVQRSEVMELLIAASYLQVEQLITQIWSCLDEVENLPGDAAYFLYLEANVLNVKCVRETMLSRISRFFLIMVAFKEFLLMPVNDLFTLLSSDTIGVNTEIEVFMVVLRWLSYDWSNRKSYVESLMRKVRLHLIPPGFLIELDRNMLENTIVRRVMSRRTVKDLVRNGLKYATAHLCYGKFIKEKSVIRERHWIYDDQCEYHIKTNQLIDYKITYPKFQNYLRNLQKCNQNYWKSFVRIGTGDGLLGKCPEELPLQNCKICTVDKLPEGEIHPDSKGKTKTFLLEKNGTRSEKNLHIVKETLNTLVENYDSKCTSCQLKEHCSNEIGDFQKNIMESPRSNSSMHTAIYKVEEELKEVSYQTGSFSQRSDPSFVESSESKNLIVHQNRESTECELSTYNSGENEIEGNQTCKTEVRKNAGSSPREDCGYEGKYVSLVSFDRVARTYNKSSSYIMSVKSTSKRNISIMSCEKNTSNDFTQNKTIISARSQDLDLKGFQFEPLSNQLPCTSMGNPTLLNAHKTCHFVTDQLTKEGKSEKVAEKTPLSIIFSKNTTMIPSWNVLFSKKTLLILGGTDPYNEYGKDAVNFMDKMLFYTNRFKKWAQLPQTFFGTRQHHAAVVSNGTVYIVGGTKVIPGCKKTFFETSIWALNPKTKKWTFETNLPKNRRDFAVISVNRDPGQSGFFVIGGESYDRVPLNSVWFYNVSKKVWIRKASLKKPRYGFSAAIVKNEIWIAGGIAYSLNSLSEGNQKGLFSRNHSQFITDTIETFKLDRALKGRKGEWIESKFRLRQKCLFGKLCATKDWKLFLIGGIGRNSGETLQSFDAIDQFNYETEEWVQCGKLQCGRHGHDVVLVDDCIAVIGGVSFQRKHAFKSIEFFCTMTSKTFRLIPDLPRPLSGLAAIILKQEW